MTDNGKGVEAVHKMESSAWMWRVVGFLTIVAFSSTLSAEDPVQYARQIQPILSKNCFSCHGPDEAQRESGLALHDPQLAYREADSGYSAIIPFDAEGSELLARISSTDESDRMPPSEHGPPLADSEVRLLRRWIAEGAKYEIHWAYKPLIRPEVPEVSNEAWCRNEVDRFVLAKLEAEGLSPAPEATPEKRVRRLYLDLIGVPPPPEVVQAFVREPTEAAYEDMVDQLLADPRYGEHWARMWLDLARYADSQGYAQDEIREIWKYRDWVIDAFNRDLPFDQFTIEQLAGDLLPDPTEAQLIATAFHRNTMTNTEGGTDDEEFRHAAVVDRTNTTGTVWLGTTVGCAQCHTHKYDPITHHDYYRLFAVFNQTADNDQPSNEPLLRQFSDEQLEEQERLRGELDRVEMALMQADDESRSELEKQRDEINNALRAIRPTTTPIMRELPPDQQRTTRVAIGGAFSNLGEAVDPGALPLFSDGLTESKVEWNRLDLARWLVASENPLTPRVAVNRHWEQFFGTGIVETSEDFGTQGNPPSHPELLDWLAEDFRNQGWSMKALSKQLVMSTTYQQASLVTPEKQERDPNNRLLSRGARFRLSAEQIRDLALSVSGLLSEKMHGPPVRPPQPKSGLSAAFGGSLDWEASPGEDRYRRAIYTLMRRTNPYPSFMAFDATNRTICSARRIRTNTPVAAFVTLNDPVFIECAQAFAKRLLTETADAPELDPLSRAFQIVVSRAPLPSERLAIESLLDELRTKYSEDVSAAAEMATGSAGEVDAPEDLPLPELAAWTVVANVLMNLDEALTRN